MAIGALMAIGGGLQLAGGLFGAGAARKRARALARQLRAENAKLGQLERSRQQIVNPYSGVTDMSNLAKDLSAKITNPFANLSVATGAAEIQMEQSDIALANTLDTLRATGASAGGATALAQAALRSKRSVAASIEQQESSNEKMRAQGQQTMEQQLRAEQMRLQQADVAGEQFMFGIRENRQMQELDRTAALLGAARQAEAQASADKTSAITGAIGSVASIAGSAFGPTT